MNAIRPRYQEQIDALPPEALENFIARSYVDSARAGFVSWEAAMTGAVGMLAKENARLMKMVLEGAMLRPPPPMMLCANCPDRERVLSQVGPQTTP